MPGDIRLGSVETLHAAYEEPTVLTCSDG